MYSMDSFSYYPGAAPTPNMKLENQDVDLSMIEPFQPGIEGGISMMGSSNHDALSSPVHIDLTGPLFDWTVPRFATDCSVVSQFDSFHQLQKVGVPVARHQFATAGIAPEIDEEALHEWQEFQEQRFLKDASGILPSQSSQLADHVPVSPRIKLEDESSLFSSDDSSEEVPSDSASGAAPSVTTKASSSKRLRASQAPHLPARRRNSLPGGRRVKAAIPSHSSLSERSLFVKSNYQHIVDGNAGPIYPDGFAAKLLSKRIAHKISEKTRRNRLTTAIREIEKLIQPEVAGDSAKARSTATAAAPSARTASTTGEVTDKQTKTTQSAISKVDVAELAVDYIKRLQREFAEAKKRAEEAENLLRVSRQLMADDSMMVVAPEELTV